jgi:hypothetical protein
MKRQITVIDGKVVLQRAAILLRIEAERAWAELSADPTAVTIAREDLGDPDLANRTVAALHRRKAVNRE